MQVVRRGTGCVLIASALGLLACAGADSGGAVDQSSTLGAAGSSANAAGSASVSSSAAAGSGSSSGQNDSSTTSSGGAASDLSALSFDVTTAPQGGKYKPKNIGAIWIQSGSGQFVKSLEVWAKTRRKYLTKYNAAVGGSSAAIDVTASATLSSHKAHHVSWNLTDKSGAAVPAGKYTLWVEVTDADAAGKAYSVDFDTSAGAQTVSPADATYFSAMSLKLQ
jgi:hypothetical protein